MNNENNDDKEDEDDESDNDSNTNDEISNERCVALMQELIRKMERKKKNWQRNSYNVYV